MIKKIFNNNSKIIKLSNLRVQDIDVNDDG